jgi:hypothetical protein
MKWIILFAASLAAAAFADTGAISASDAWMRALPPTAQTGAVYLDLHNSGAQPRTVVAASSPLAGSVEVHEHRHADGMMQMREVEALVIEAGDTARFRPGGLHLMLFGLERVPGEGEGFTMTLEFDDGTVLDFEVEVRPRGS